jgi:hypothetical protein
MHRKSAAHDEYGMHHDDRQSNNQFKEYDLSEDRRHSNSALKALPAPAAVERSYDTGSRRLGSIDSRPSLHMSQSKARRANDPGSPASRFTSPGKKMVAIRKAGQGGALASTRIDPARLERSAAKV